MITVKQLACLLITYECDDPHSGKDDSAYYPTVTEDELDKWLAQEHFGDCIGEANLCERCFAEERLYKAKWLHPYLYQ